MTNNHQENKIMLTDIFIETHRAATKAATEARDFAKRPLPTINPDDVDVAIMSIPELALAAKKKDPSATSFAAYTHDEPVTWEHLSADVRRPFYGPMVANAIVGLLRPLILKPEPVVAQGDTFMSDESPMHRTCVLIEFKAIEEFVARAERGRNFEKVKDAWAERHGASASASIVGNNVYMHLSWGTETHVAPSNWQEMTIDAVISDAERVLLPYTVDAIEAALKVRYPDACVSVFGGELVVQPTNSTEPIKRVFASLPKGSVVQVVASLTAELDAAKELSGRSSGGGGRGRGKHGSSARV